MSGGAAGFLHDGREYKPDTVETIDRASGVDATSQQRAKREDRETAKSEETGTVSKSEIDSLKADQYPDEQNVEGRTRGIKVDAFKQEREMDKFLDEQGITDADQDVEISKASGRA
ncbi:hypothetical protein PUNSTDRAFT_133501 [Punctularia strigosozonata HHB-11173 SS5]|uniref:uncharacterized protein n=1 Tax=Punctularia strigosozonata (strain HHB-11173) TaxID=741275 RepID=UPI0004417257|nr:uncharacterized protein PUNSTDRAFT_133501 [Punctularia strigosozonata HHB-11173 SS5]EIN09728.1 hypothetical protein PUNSTDRAFT_133501 [Punctularia strigosozonata HHB-11173 SS5]